MYLSSLTISGFRGIKNCSLTLTPHSVLLAQNNTGKTTIMEAIALLLGRGKLVRQLAEFDFFGGNPTPTDRIHIKGVITNLGTNDPNELSHIFNMKTAIPIYWNENLGKVEPYNEENQQGSLSFKIGFSARFDKDILEVETVRYFVDSDEVDPFIDGEIHPVSLQLLKTIGYFLIPSKRTWDKVISFSSDMFNQIVQSQDAIPAEAIIQMKNWLKNPPQKLEETEGIKDLCKNVNDELSAFFGKAESNLKFIPTSGDTPGILQSIYPYLLHADGIELPIGRHGSGLISLQSILLLLEFGRIRAKNNENFIIAAEEPELHLHPGQHRRLVSRIRGLSNQSIITTHSPEIASYYEPQEIIILQNNSGNILGNRLIDIKSNIPDANSILRLYTIYRNDICNALMHSTVVLPEGLTEFYWFRMLIRSSITAEGWTPDTRTISLQTIGVIPTQDSNVVNTYKHFSKIANCIIPLIDGDSAGNKYIEDLLQESSSPNIIIQLSNSCSLEDLILWFIEGSPSLSKSIYESFEKLCTSGSTIAEKLKSDSLKKRWDIHEQVAGLIGSSQEASERVRNFFNDIANISINKSPYLDTWKLCEEKSNNSFNLWHFKCK